MLVKAKIEYMSILKNKAIIFAFFSIFEIAVYIHIIQNS